MQETTNNNLKHHQGTQPFFTKDHSFFFNCWRIRMFSSRRFTSHLHYIHVRVVLDYSCCKYYLWYPLESSHWLGVSDWSQLKLGFLVTQLESITTHDSTRLEPTAPFAYVLYRIYITDANVVNGLWKVLIRTFVFFNNLKEMNDTWWENWT
jgi:hypothetical protein